MKKLFITSVLLVSTFIAMAQQVKFGAKAGINYSSLSGSGTTAKAGFLFGGFAEIKLTKKLSFQPELFYATGGGKYSYNGVLASNNAVYEYNQNISLSSINLPLLLKIDVTKKINFYVGPQISYNESARSKVSATYKKKNRQYF